MGPKSPPVTTPELLSTPESTLRCARQAASVTGVEEREDVEGQDRHKVDPEPEPAQGRLLECSCIVLVIV